MFFRKIRTLYNRVSTSEKPEHIEIFLFVCLSPSSLPDLSFSFFLPILSPSPASLSYFLFSSFSFFFFSFLSLFLFFLSFLSSSPFLFPFSPSVSSCSGEPGVRPSARCTRSGLARAAQARPRLTDRHQPRPDPASPGQIRPSPGRQPRNLSWTARARAVLFAATPFRRRFPRLHTSTCNCCHCRHARAFGSRFRGP